MTDDTNFRVSDLGTRSIPSPVSLSVITGDSLANYVRDDELVRYNVQVAEKKISDRSQFFEKAGPRQNIYFNPQHVRAGIVTCGGLCPGLNDVIRSIVRCLWYRYTVRRISGIRFGYRGLLPEYGLDLRELDPVVVDDIHKLGGTLLGSSRGEGERTSEIVDAIERLNLNMLFAIGGDGTQKGALAIADEIDKRKLKISIVGIPKTIDNDLLYVDRSFGFETAVARATEAVSAAHTEAHSSLNGIGLVKLMGRESGFIAVHTVLAAHEANFVLIPEVDFDLDGPNGLFSHLERRLRERHHAVVVVAEGAGQRHMESTGNTDASGNKRLNDIGLFLKEHITAHFKSREMEINLKYIDPSYLVRSAPADPSDSVYCERLGNNAVHAAMAGKTRIIIGMVNNEFVHIPSKAAIAKRNYVDPEGSLWRDAIEATRQALRMTNGG